MGRLDEFELKSNDYLETSPCYKYIGTINQQQTEQYHLKEILELIDAQLQVLYEGKLINEDQFRQFSTSKRTNLKLPRIYFLPDINDGESHHFQMRVQPRFSSFRYSPIQHLAQYIHRLIQPLFERVCQSTIVLNSHDFCQRLRDFWLRSTESKLDIQFATFKIRDLYANISYKELLFALSTLLTNPLITSRQLPFSADCII